MAVGPATTRPAADHLVMSPTIGGGGRGNTVTAAGAEAGAGGHLRRLQRRRRCRGGAPAGPRQDIPGPLMPAAGRLLPALGVRRDGGGAVRQPLLGGAAWPRHGLRHGTIGAARSGRHQTGGDQPSPAMPRSIRTSSSDSIGAGRTIVVRARPFPRRLRWLCAGGAVTRSTAGLTSPNLATFPGAGCAAGLPARQATTWTAPMSGHGTGATQESRRRRAGKAVAFDRPIRWNHLQRAS